MPRPLDIDMPAQVACHLRLTLEYLITQGHLRDLFALQEMLSRHAADAAWRQSEQALGPMPMDMPAQLAELERQQRLQDAMASWKHLPEED